MLVVFLVEAVGDDVDDSETRARLDIDKRLVHILWENVGTGAALDKISDRAIL